MFEEQRLTHWPGDEKQKVQWLSPLLDTALDVTDLAMKMLNEDSTNQNEDEEMMRRGRRRR